MIARWAESQNVNAHAFSPDGSLLTAAQDDGDILLRDARNGKLVRLLKPPDTSVASVSFLPDGRTLASCGSDGALYLWRIK